MGSPPAEDRICHRLPPLQSHEAGKAALNFLGVRCPRLQPPPESPVFPDTSLLPAVSSLALPTAAHEHAALPFLLPFLLPSCPGLQGWARSEGWTVQGAGTEPQGDSSLRGAAATAPP